MTISVEWMDGVKREYEEVSATSGEGVLKIWKTPYYGAKREQVAEVPLHNVREWKSTDY